MQFRDSQALFVRWEQLVALVHWPLNESLQPASDQVQQLAWMWAVFQEFNKHYKKVPQTWNLFQDFDTKFKSHIDAFLIVTAHEGSANRLLAYKAFNYWLGQPDSAGMSLYNTDRARELNSKKWTKLFEEHGRKLSGTKKDDNDGPIRKLRAPWGAGRARSRASTTSELTTKQCRSQG